MITPILPGWRPAAVTLPAFEEIFGKKRLPFVFPGGRTIRPSLPIDWIVD
jgi:hypothetical protein